MTVDDVMTRDVISVRTDTPFRRVVELLREHRVSGVAVVDSDGRVVGVVSEGDLIVKGHRPHGSSFQPLFASSDGTREHKRRIDGQVAGELMTTPALCIDADADVRAAAQMMSQRRVRRLPVTRDGKLCGIVSRADVLKSFSRSDEEIKREITEDIFGRKVRGDLENIELDVIDGVVTLRGHVRRSSTVSVVAYHLDRIDGVTRVNNELTYGVDDTETPDIGPAPIGPLELIL